MDVNLKYPVALINNGDVGGFSSPATLQICGEKTIDDHQMVGAKVVDSDGNQYVITNAIKVKNINWLPSFLVAYDRRIVKVKYELSKGDQLSLDTFKALVVDTLKGNASFDDSGLLRCVKGSESYYEVIESTGID